MADLPSVASQADYDAVPPGQSYTSNGQTYIKAAPSASAQATPAQTTGAFGSSPGDSFAQGLGDLSRGLVQKVTNAIPQSIRDQVPQVTETRDPFGHSTYTNTPDDQKVSATDVMDKQNQDYEAARHAAGRDGMDWYRMAGATAPLIAGAPEVATAKGAAALGAATGFVDPVFNSKNGTDFWENTAENTGLGALLGGASDTVGKFISPKVHDAVKLLMSKGVYPTLGQISSAGGGIGGKSISWIENQTSKLPFIGDLIKHAKGLANDEFNKAAYKDALIPVGETSTEGAGNAGIKEVADKISDHYDTVKQKMDFQIDPLYAKDIVDHTIQAAKLPQAQQEQWSRILQDFNSQIGPGGHAGGNEINTAQSVLKDWSDKLQKSVASDAYDKSLGQIVSSFDNAIDDNLMRNSPKGIADDLANARISYALYKRIEDAANAAKNKQGVFSPGQYMAAVGRKSGKKETAQGTGINQEFANAGTKVLGQTVPDSGTTGGLTTWDLAKYGAGAVTGGDIGAHYPLLSAITGSLATVPYLSRKASAYALTKRPDWAPTLASGVRNVGPIATTNAVTEPDADQQTQQIFNTGAQQ